MLLRNREPKITIIAVSVISEGWPKPAIVLAWALSYGCGQMLAGGCIIGRLCRAAASTLAGTGCWLSAGAVQLEHLQQPLHLDCASHSHKTEFQVGNSKNKCSMMQDPETASSEGSGWNRQGASPDVIYRNRVLGILKEVLFGSHPDSKFGQADRSS